MNEKHIDPKKKEYIWTPDMDYEEFIRVNGIDKNYDPNYKTFLRFEREHVELITDIQDNA